jgi:hypothetical protein
MPFVATMSLAFSKNRLRFLWDLKFARRVWISLTAIHNREFPKHDDFFLAHSGRLLGVVDAVEYGEKDNSCHCSCCAMMRNGSPCIHQLVFLHHRGQLPGVDDFNTHWLADVEPGHGGRGSAWTQDEMTSDEDIDTANHEDGTEQSLPEVDDWDIGRTMAELQNRSNRNAYLTLFHFGKWICLLLPALQDLRMEMMTALSGAPNSEQDIRDVRDALARPRCRSKKRQLPNDTVRKAKINKHAEMIMCCDLCESSHQLVKCPHYDLVLWRRLNNSRVVPATVQRKRSLCGGSGHQNRKRPCRPELKTRCHQQEASLEDDVEFGERLDPNDQQNMRRRERVRREEET